MAKSKGIPKEKILVSIPEQLLQVYGSVAHLVEGGMSALVTRAMILASREVLERAYESETYYGDVWPITEQDLLKLTTPLIPWKERGRYKREEDMTTFEIECRDSQRRAWYEKHNRFGANQEPDLWEKEPDKPIRLDESGDVILGED